MARKLLMVSAFALLCALTWAHVSSGDSYESSRPTATVAHTSKSVHGTHTKHRKISKCKYDSDDDDDDNDDAHDDGDADYKHDNNGDEENKHYKGVEDSHAKKDGDDDMHKENTEYTKLTEPTSYNKVKHVTAKKCMFKFCDGKRVVYVGKSDRALTAPICSTKYGVKIGSVDQTGEAMLVNYKRIRISKWKPYGLKQHFAPSFFKSYTKHDKNVSGVGHEVAQQNQAKFLDKKCWILPLKAYQVWNKKTGGWVENYGTDPYVHCISFCTRVTKHHY